MSGESLATTKSCIILMATYNDWQSIAYMLPTLDNELASLGMQGKVVVVDDGSLDLTGQAEIAEFGLRAIGGLEVVRLGANQGNQRAMAIGLAYVAANETCDYLVSMDSDNEDKPEFVSVLLKACMDQSDPTIIFAERTKRSESLLFRCGYVLYKKIYKLLTGRSIAYGNFCAIPGKFLPRITHIPELWSHLPAAIMRSGLPMKQIPSVRGQRVFGSGKMNVYNLIIHAFSGFAVFADVMAARMIVFALFVGGIFFTALTATSVIKAITGSRVLIPGWTSLFMMHMATLFALFLGIAFVILFMVLSLKIRPPLIPYHDYRRFVWKIERLSGGRWTTEAAEGS